MCPVSFQPQTHIHMGEGCLGKAVILQSGKHFASLSINGLSESRRFIFSLCGPNSNTRVDP